MERKKICSLMDCQKLSREACAHAAQNDRLPVQTVVQVLYYEQQRLRNAMNDNNLISSEVPLVPSKSTNSFTRDIHPVSDELSNLKRENQDLKLELVKMKMRLKEMERSTSRSSANSASSSPLGLPSSMNKPPLTRKSFMNAVSKKLSRLHLFGKLEGGLSSNRCRTKPPKDRRHSIS